MTFSFFFFENFCVEQKKNSHHILLLQIMDTALLFTYLESLFLVAGGDFQCGRIMAIFFAIILFAEG